MSCCWLKVEKANEKATIPNFAHETDSGFDLYCMEDFEIGFGEIKIVDTGIYFEIPDGFEIQIRSKSGLSLKHGIQVVNSPGTIDQDYRDTIKVLLGKIKNDYKVTKFNAGDKIAQGVLKKREKVIIKEVDKINKNTERGTGGFGSTGK